MQNPAQYPQFYQPNPQQNNELRGLLYDLTRQLKDLKGVNIGSTDLKQKLKECNEKVEKMKEEKEKEDKKKKDKNNEAKREKNIRRQKFKAEATRLQRKKNKEATRPLNTWNIFLNNGKKKNRFNTNNRINIKDFDEEEFEDLLLDIINGLRKMRDFVNFQKIENFKGKIKEALNF